MPRETKQSIIETDLHGATSGGLIYHKRHEADVAAHISLPQMSNNAGLMTFCAQRFWPAVQTQSQKQVAIWKWTMCERCMTEYKIAETELKARGFIK